MDPFCLCTIELIQISCAAENAAPDASSPSVPLTDEPGFPARESKRRSDRSDGADDTDDDVSEISSAMSVEGWPELPEFLDRRRCRSEQTEPRNSDYPQG